MPWAERTSSLALPKLLELLVLTTGIAGVHARNYLLALPENM